MFELKPTRSFKLPWSKLLQMIGVAREGHIVSTAFFAALNGFEAPTPYGGSNYWSTR